jgi:4-hydroxyphenylpyruvate dioxygenase
MEIDRIHFYVADAARIQDLLIRQMGLRFLGNQLNEHTIEYLVGNSQLLFSISSPLNLASPVAEYLQHHPSGVKNISFRVRDLDLIKHRGRQMGVDVLAASSPDDELKWLKIQGWGAVEYTFIQDLPRVTDPIEDPIVGIDHLVLNVAAGELEPATVWHQTLFDFQVHQTFDIQTQTSGLTSKALISTCGKIQVTLKFRIFWISIKELVFNILLCRLMKFLQLSIECNSKNYLSSRSIVLTILKSKSELEPLKNQF